MSKFIAWLKSLFSKGKAEMTDLVAGAECVIASTEATVVADAGAAVTAVEAVVTDPTVAADVAAIAVDLDDVAAKIKAIYDKLGVVVPAWSEVLALLKAL